MTPFEQRLSNIIEPSLTGLGYTLVRVQMNGQTRKTLQIMAERNDRRAMTLDDCTTISETLSAVLDVHDPIKERYALEISSPGIDRPLTRPQDYTRFIGFEAKIDLAEMRDGRRHFRGIIRATTETDVTIEMEKAEQVALPFHAIQRAKMVLTDELIDAHLAEAEAAQNAPDQTPISIETDAVKEA